MQRPMGGFGGKEGVTKLLVLTQRFIRLLHNFHRYTAVNRGLLARLYPLANRIICLTLVSEIVQRAEGTHICIERSMRLPRLSYAGAYRRPV